MSVVGAGTLVAAPADAATTITISGTLKLNNTAAPTSMFVAACAGDCLSSQDFTDAVQVGAGGAFSLTVPSGSYALAIEGLVDQPGYDDASGASIPGYGAEDLYFLLPSDSTKWSVTDDYSGSTKRTYTANTTLAINVGQAIHNPTRVVHLHTEGTINAETCAGHTTTISDLQPFADLPAGGTVSYQWYTGSSIDTLAPIPGATGLSFTPPASLVGQQLIFGVKATAPNRVAWQAAFGPLDSVANPGTCVASIPSSAIGSFGKKVGKAIHGKRVKVKGAKAAAGISTSYNWTLNGKVVHHGKSYKLPKSARHKKLAVQVVFSAPGYQSVSKTLKFGKVK